MQMGTTKTRHGLLSLGMWLLGSLMAVDAVLAQGEVSFISARRGLRPFTKLAVALG
jgi:hypothetical protein